MSLYDDSMLKAYIWNELSRPTPNPFLDLFTGGDDEENEAPPPRPRSARSHTDAERKARDLGYENADLRMRIDALEKKNARLAKRLKAYEAGIERFEQVAVEQIRQAVYDICEGERSVAEHTIGRTFRRDFYWMLRDIAISRKLYRAVKAAFALPGARPRAGIEKPMDVVYRVAVAIANGGEGETFVRVKDPRSMSELYERNDGERAFEEADEIVIHVPAWLTWGVETFLRYVGHGERSGEKLAFQTYGANTFREVLFFPAWWRCDNAQSLDEAGRLHARGEQAVAGDIARLIAEHVEGVDEAALRTVCENAFRGLDEITRTDSPAPDFEVLPKVVAQLSEEPPCFFSDIAMHLKDWCFWHFSRAISCYDMEDVNANGFKRGGPGGPMAEAADALSERVRALLDRHVRRTIPPDSEAARKLETWEKRFPNGFCIYRHSGNFFD